MALSNGIDNDGDGVHDLQCSSQRLGVSGVKDIEGIRGERFAICAQWESSRGGSLDRNQSRGPQGAGRIELNVDDLSNSADGETEPLPTRLNRLGELNGGKGLPNLGIAIQQARPPNGDQGFDEPSFGGAGEGNILCPGNDDCHKVSSVYPIGRSCQVSSKWT